MIWKLTLAAFLLAGAAASTAPSVSAMRPLINDQPLTSYASAGCGAEPKIPDGCSARCDCTPPDADGNQECKWTVSCP